MFLESENLPSSATKVANLPFLDPEIKKCEVVLNVEPHRLKL